MATLGTSGSSSHDVTVPAIRLDESHPKSQPGKAPLSGPPRWSHRVQIPSVQGLSSLLTVAQQPPVSWPLGALHRTAKHGSHFPQSEGARGGARDGHSLLYPNPRSGIPSLWPYSIY